MKKQKTLILNLLAVLLASTLLTSCSTADNKSTNNENIASVESTENKQDVISEEEASSETLSEDNKDIVDNKDTESKDTDSKDTDSKDTESNVNSTEKNIFDGYRIIEVDGGDLSGHREPNVAVNIGFGNREYWAFTNEYGQLVKVVAKQIILQDDKTEPVKSNGRYYNDEAKVPGTERKDLDEGHVIADSLGGVSNAYNITPQNSSLNRHGDQAYMEKVIRQAGGCTDFVAIITYPNNTTQIPSHYSYTYTINGNVINDEFDNINPEEYNASLNSNTSQNSSTPAKEDNSISNNASSTNTSEVVYWTPNGKSYHTRKTCPTLSRSKTILEGTISESGKYDPCDRCH